MFATLVKPEAQHALWEKEYIFSWLHSISHQNSHELLLNHTSDRHMSLQSLAVYIHVHVYIHCIR